MQILMTMLALAFLAGTKPNGWAGTAFRQDATNNVVQKGQAPKVRTTMSELLELRATERDFRHGIEVLKKADAIADASRARAAGDRRLIGLYGYSVEIPGLKGSEPPNSFTVVPLPATRDMIRSQAQDRFQSLVRSYAERYNQSLIQ